MIILDELKEKEKRNEDRKIRESSVQSKENFDEDISRKPSSNWRNGDKTVFKKRTKSKSVNRIMDRSGIIVMM